jgi:hypothetical protein
MQIKNIICLILLVCLSGCTSSRCQTPLVTKQQICADLRRQLIFYGDDPSPSNENPLLQSTANWNSPTKQAMLLRRYRQNDCDSALRECPMPAVLSLRP